MTTSRTSPLVAGLLAAGLAAGILSGCTASPAAAGDPTTPAAPVPDGRFAGVPLVPDSGVALGVFYGDGDQESTDAALGTTPLIHLTYVGWDDAWTQDPVLAEDADRGQVSLVNWEPEGVDFHDVVAGRYDDLLRQRSAEAAQLPAPVFVDFAAEMNEEEGWGGHDTQLYVEAYRHVHDLVDAEADGKIVWVWAPNNVDSEGAPAALEYYPGDDYVDWTGIDGYNWGTSDPDFVWQSFESVFRDLYDDLHTLGKPILIGETASAEEGGDKAAWIASIASTLQQQFPDVRGLVWFDVDKERDWRVRSSDESLAAFQDLAADPFFRSAAS